MPSLLHCGLLSPARLLIFFRLPNLIVTFLFQKLDVFEKVIDFPGEENGTRSLYRGSNSPPVRPISVHL